MIVSLRSDTAATCSDPAGRFHAGQRLGHAACERLETGRPDHRSRFAVGGRRAVHDDGAAGRALCGGDERRDARSVARAGCVHTRSAHNRLIVLSAYFTDSERDDNELGALACVYLLIYDPIIVICHLFTIRPSYCVIDCGADGSDGVRHPRSPKKAGTVMFEGTVEANDAIERRKAVRPR